MYSFFRRPFRREIETARIALSDLQENWPGRLIVDRGDEPTIYEGYPYLFLDAFPLLTRSDVRPLALAGRLFSSSIIVYDKVMDRTPANRSAQMVSDALHAQAAQFEAYHILHRLFTPDALFWERFRSYLSGYAEACLQERVFASGERSWREYTEMLALKVAAGKAAITKVAVAGLVELAQDDTLLCPLEESIDCYNIAYQMWDDLHDWKEDLKAGIPSVLLARALSEYSTQENRQEMTRWLTRELYYGGHAQYTLQLALDSLERADSLTAGAPDLLWHHTIASLRHQCEQLLSDINRIVGNNLRRAQEQLPFTLTLPPAQDMCQQLAWDALHLIVRQWQLGFGEARHIMYLPHREGFSAAQEYHYGDIFQRALIVDTLCDIEAFSGRQLQPVIEHEVGYLLDHRLTSGVGGWSYLPTALEVAPDADVLGQVMQVLLRTGHKEEVAEHCEIPLSVLLCDNARANGSFETWIIPATGRTSQQERQVECNQKWGAGPDNEVMANLLYALARYDPKRFAEKLRRGVAYLESRQETDGHWISRWYYGPYYGTYVCLRLLAAVHPGSDAFSAALSFLRESQRSDGGWGLGNESDPLSTSLALLGLASIWQLHNIGDVAQVWKAVAYLQHSRESEEGWPAVQFIRPRVDEPYSSRTMTAMYVMKATVAWHKLVAEQPHVLRQMVV